MNMARQRKKEATLVARQALVKSKRVLQTITFVKCKSKRNKANVAMPQKKQTTQHKDSTKHNTKGQHKDSTNGDQNQTAQGHAKILQNNAIFTSHKNDWQCNSSGNAKHSNAMQNAVQSNAKQRKRMAKENKKAEQAK